MPIIIVISNMLCCASTALITSLGKYAAARGNRIARGIMGR